MAAVKSIDTGLRLGPRELPGHRFFAGLTTYLSALREASVAAHAYEEMMRRGTPHVEAVKRVFEEHLNGRR
jgi:hypothetical protein